MSKRDGDRLGFPVFPLSWNGGEKGDSFTGFRETGFDPAALINFLAFLGWNPGTEQEMFSLDELVETFSLERIGKSGARFDYEKAKWYNQQYLFAATNEELGQQLLPVFESKGWNTTNEVAAQIAGMFKERSVFLADIPRQAAFLFEDDFAIDEKMARKKWKSDLANHHTALKNQLAGSEDFSPAQLEATIKGYITDNGLKFGDIMAPLRLAISGVGGGPSLFDILSLLGKDKVVERLDKNYAAFAEMQEA